MFQRKTAVAVLAVGLAAGVTFATAKAQTSAEPKPEEKPAKTQLFMLLPYETREQIAARAGTQQKLYWGTWAAYGKTLAEAGVLAGGSALQSPSEARTLRSQKGRLQTTTGSYASTKEQISGYLLLKVRTMEEARRWAARCPAVEHGGAVEIRPTLPVMASDMQ